MIVRWDDGGGSFGDVDLYLSVEQVNVECAIDGNAVSVRPEDVADHLAVREGMVGDRLADSA
jgi:hypothetical protein